MRDVKSVCLYQAVVMDTVRSCVTSSAQSSQSRLPAESQNAVSNR